MNKIIALLLLTIFFISCKNRKTGTEVEYNINKNNYLKVLDKRSMDWKYIEIKAEVEYKTDPNLPKLTAYLRMEKGKHIWVSVRSIIGEVSRILIKEDSIHALMRFPNREYHVLPTSMLNNYVPGIKGLQEVQNLLLNEAPFPKGAYDWEETALDSFVLDYSNPYLTNKLSGERKVGRILNCLIESIDKSYKANISYTNPTEVDKKSLPYNLEITGNNHRNAVHILINYKEVQKKESLDFPFKVGDSYERK